MFWYKDFLCCFFRFHFVRISSDFSSGALWQNVLPQDFATNSFVRISLGFRQNFFGTWVEATKSVTKFQRFFHDHFFVAKGLANGLPQGLPWNLQRNLQRNDEIPAYCKSWAVPSNRCRRPTQPTVRIHHPLHWHQEELLDWTAVHWDAISAYLS